MALILNGTDGLSDVDGTAATPAIRGTDTNTGIFFPAADTIAFSEGGTEAMRLGSTGNIGIGATDNANIRLLVKQAVDSDVGGIGFQSVDGASTAVISELNSGALVVRNGGAERMRIDSSGNLLVGTTNSSVEVGVGVKLGASATIPYISTVFNTAGAANTYLLYNTNATNNGYRFYVASNGGVVNYSGNNVNLSDERTKTNIILADSYLDKICAIPVKLFNYKDEAEGEQRTLGVIAQDVEAVAPEFVNNDGWEGTEPEDGVQLKTIYTTDMMFGMMKAIQELKATVDAQAARIAALENPPVESVTNE
jgi:hypothetical protein